MPDLKSVLYSIERCTCHIPDACRDCAYDAGHSYNECVELLLRDTLELLKAQEAKWISVKGRLPEEDVYVLAYNGVAPFIAAYTTNPSYRWYAISGFTICPTYWMPLPEPPKEET